MNSLMNIQDLQSFYSGFWIKNPIGNNAFSFSQRTQKQIYVPPFAEGPLGEVREGREIVFSEIVDDLEVNRRGLEKFIYLSHEGKNIFVFDNHNHAFFVWVCALRQGMIRKGEFLVHIDQHTDMREPTSYWTLPDFLEDIDLKVAFDYTNGVLNVGNFIKPALESGIFSDVKIVNTTAGMDEALPEGFVLDIDLDFLSSDIPWNEGDFKIERLKNFIARSSFITIATSPYFMDQAKAISTLRELLEPNE